MKEETKQLLSIGGYTAKWLLITAIIGLSMGTLSTFFLENLTYVTDVRLANPWLFSILPTNGIVFTYLYTRFRRNTSRGNNLTIEQGNGGEENISLRLTPLTLSGAVTTHLFGGSIGREGMAVQTGGTIANIVGKAFRLSALERQVIIINRISAGFSSAFGTPLAGTVSELEVLAVGRACAEAFFPSFFAGLFANFVTKSFGVTHTHHLMGKIPTWSVELFVKLLLASICFGLTGWVFSRSIVFLKKTYVNRLANVHLHAFLGAAIVVLFVLALNNQRYLDSSLPLLKDIFVGNAQPFNLVGELSFTILFLGTGFQGGEMTPSSEIRATLGSSLAPLLHLSIPFLAGLGFIGAFSGATNTSIACFIMGIELFDSEATVYFFMVYLISFMCPGNSGIYAPQQSLYRKRATEYSLLNALRNRRK